MLRCTYHIYHIAGWQSLSFKNHSGIYFVYCVLCRYDYHMILYCMLALFMYPSKPQWMILNGKTVGGLTVRCTYIHHMIWYCMLVYLIYHLFFNHSGFNVLSHLSSNKGTSSISENVIIKTTVLRKLFFQDMCENSPPPSTPAAVDDTALTAFPMQYAHSIHSGHTHYW